MALSHNLLQTVITASSQLVALSIGGSSSYPAVLIQQLMSNDSTIDFDMETGSWIASMHGFAGIGSIIMPSIMQWKGRKIAYAASGLIFSIGLILTATAASAKTIIITESISGLGCYCMTIVNFLTVSEMLAPKYRTVAMTSVSLIQIIGISAGSLIGTLVHWKTLAVLISVPIILSISTVWFWPESPSWLAYKGRFEDCKAAFLRLRGTDEVSLQELNALIAAQKESRAKVSRGSKLRKICSNVKRKDFYIPNALMLLILVTFYLSGSVVWYIYAYNIVLQVTGSIYLAKLCHLILNINYLITPVIPLLLVKCFNSKTVILSTGSACVVSTLCCSLILYLQSVHILEKDSILFMISFVGYFFCVCSGYNVVSYALSLELMPVRHKGIGGGLYIVYMCVLHALTVKLFPFLNLYTNLWGTFLMGAVFGIIGLLLMWRFLPNAKNRTLQEIEDYYNYGNFVKERNLDIVDVTQSIIVDNINYRRSVIV